MWPLSGHFCRLTALRCFAPLRPTSARLSDCGRIARRRTRFWAKCAVARIVPNRASLNASGRWRSTATFAHAHALIGLAKYLTGRIEETEAHVLEALRISPLDYRAGTWLQYAGVAKLLAGRDEEAVTRLNRSIELNPNLLPAAYFILAAALARVGRVDEARDAARVGLELDPGFTVARMRSSPFSDNPIYRAGRERIYEGMRVAGVPEE